MQETTHSVERAVFDLIFESLSIRFEHSVCCPARARQACVAIPLVKDGVPIGPNTSCDSVACDFEQCSLS